MVNKMANSMSPGRPYKSINFTGRKYKLRAGQKDEDLGDSNRIPESTSKTFAYAELVLLLEVESNDQERFHEVLDALNETGLLQKQLATTACVIKTGWANTTSSLPEKKTRNRIVQNAFVNAVTTEVVHFTGFNHPNLLNQIRVYDPAHPNACKRTRG